MLHRGQGSAADASCSRAVTNDRFGLLAPPIIIVKPFETRLARMRP
jgi:hypothetical protein